MLYSQFEIGCEFGELKGTLKVGKVGLQGTITTQGDGAPASTVETSEVTEVFVLRPSPPALFIRCELAPTVHWVPPPLFSS